MNRPVEILLVDDSLSDVDLSAEAFAETGLSNHLHVAENGVEALAFLRKKGKHASAPRPDLILLDLNMPKMNGQEILGRIKKDPRLRHIPVIVLTTSQAKEDVLQSYNLHANCYITKPVDFEQFLKVIRSIEEFWFATVTLPSE